ncbi:MAG: hypothetical protein KDB14_05165 [Planctomycetales bacterium]|nr:hypothetical protein [Planctomycetales bacterium]
MSNIDNSPVVWLHCITSNDDSDFRFFFLLKSDALDELLKVVRDDVLSSVISVQEFVDPS